MPVIEAGDADFKIAEIDFDGLMQLQLRAEERGFATRWTSVDGLRQQVGEGRVLLQSMLREERSGAVRAYRCLALFRLMAGSSMGGVATIDIDPEAYEMLPRIDRDPDVRAALVRVFVLATGGIEMTSKQ